MPARIAGLGMALPKQARTNHALAQIVDTSDEWIWSRTGIRERRIAADDESTFSLGLGAGRAALEQAGLQPEQVELVIVATMTPDLGSPAVANLVQDSLGARTAGAIDINTACTGFIYGLSLATAMVDTGQVGNALVIGSETMSRILDWSDRSTCVLFGDGAGAAVIDGGGADRSFLAFSLGSDGGGAGSLYRANSYGLLDQFPGANGSLDLQMDGREVYKFATRALTDTVVATAEKAGVALEDLDLIVPHQANVRIIKSAAEQLGLPMERFVVNVERYGNTSAASIPIALAESDASGRLAESNLVMLVAFGAGLSWAGALLRTGS
ncbi:MAG: ketoacyl-ACP synthase III [Chloroflexota bacterium]|nr:ketoacyl-ACP synthase III [Chloroflexota bacterium]